MINVRINSPKPEEVYVSRVVTNMRAYVKSYGWPPDKMLRTDADGNVIADDAPGGASTGGYYTPSVDDYGNLTWTASDPGMPEVDGANIAGKPGKSAYQFAVDGGYIGTEAEFAKKLAKEMPTALPNPNALTFTGAVTGSYDGSAPLSVEIPQGGGGGSSSSVTIDASLTVDGAAADAAAVGNRLNELSEEISGYIKTPSKAEVGQIIRVSAVDDNGKPTEFEPYSLKIDVATTSVNYWIQYEEIPAKTMKRLESMRILEPPPGAEYFIAKNSGIGRFPMLLFVTDTSKDGTGDHFVSADVYNLGNEDVTLFEEELSIYPVYVKIAE